MQVVVPAAWFTSTRRPTRPSAPPYNTTDESPSALAAGSCVHAGLRRGEQFARPHRRTTLRPTHPFAPSGDSSMVDFSFTMVTINSMTDNFRPNISGDIYLSLFLTHCFCQKNSYFGPYILISMTIIHYKTWLRSTRWQRTTRCSSVSHYTANEREQVAVPVARFTSACRGHAYD